MADDLVKQLREGALEKQQEAWDRADGGQDLSIEAGLALVAADRLESLEAALQSAWRSWIGRSWLAPSGLAVGGEVGGRSAPGGSWAGEEMRDE